MSSYVDMNTYTGDEMFRASYHNNRSLAEQYRLIRDKVKYIKCGFEYSQYGYLDNCRLPHSRYYNVSLPDQLFEEGPSYIIEEELI